GWRTQDDEEPAQVKLASHLVSRFREQPRRQSIVRGSVAQRQTDIEVFRKVRLRPDEVRERREGPPVGKVALGHETTADVQRVIGEVPSPSCADLARSHHPSDVGGYQEEYRVTVPFGDLLPESSLDRDHEELTWPVAGDSVVVRPISGRQLAGVVGKRLALRQPLTEGVRVAEEEQKGGGRVVRRRREPPPLLVSSVDDVVDDLLALSGPVPGSDRR